MSTAGWLRNCSWNPSAANLRSNPNRLPTNEGAYLGLELGNAIVGASVEMFLFQIAEVKLKVAPSSPTHPRSAAFASAVERGAAWAREEYARPDNLAIEQVASYVGLPIETVFERFTNGLYYALAPDSEHFALKFPKWQFDAEHSRVVDLFRILREASVGAWTIQSFMLSPNCLLQDRTPREWILNPQADMNVLLQMAWSRFASDQGAG